MGSRPRSTGSAFQPPVLLWFRDDRRLADHAALHAALDTGRPVVPVYVLDDAAGGPWAIGAAARWWLHHSLAALAESLEQRGAGLVLRRGDALGAIQSLLAETGATDIFAGVAVEPWARRLDAEIAAAVAPARLHRSVTRTLFRPDLIRTQAGGPYMVHGPFARACAAQFPLQPTLPAPARIPSPPLPRSDRLEDWALLP